MNNPLIIMKEVEKVYRSSAKVSTRALASISCTINSGEFLAVTGQSGSGKSTFLNLLALIDSPTKGTITVDGENITTFSEEQNIAYRLRSVGMVFQFFNLIENYTAEENIMFQLQLQGMGRMAARRKARETLGFLGIESKATSYPRDLSGGQQQRVAVGRAVAKESKFLLADEPTAHLDAKSGEELMDLLHTLNTEMGRTIIMVTHEPSQAQRANRIIELRDGQVVGTTSAAGEGSL